MSNVSERTRCVPFHSSISRVSLGGLFTLAALVGACTRVSTSTKDSETGGVGSGNTGAAAGSVSSAGGPSAGASVGGAAGAAGVNSGGTLSGSSGAFGSGGSGGSSEPVDPAGYQAEAAFFSGGVAVAKDAAAFTGTGYLTNFAASGAQVIFALNVPAAGVYDVSLRYANTGSSSATLSVSVNGYAAGQTTLASSGTTETWANVKESLTLRPGLNTVTYRREANDNGSVDIDALLVPGGLSLATRGATSAYTEYEAEAGTHTGTVLGPSREFGTIPAESSGRQAVRLDSLGQEVTFTLKAPANALVIRYSIPDSADGAGTQATLGLYAGADHVTDIPLDSAYSWVYGGYPYADPPSAGSPHHYFDERRVLIAEQPAGTVIHLRKDAAASAANYVIDLVDFEEVAPAYVLPANFISIASHGAKKDDGLDDTDAINQTIAEAQSAKKGVFIPEGTFEIASRINLADVTIAGAGQWYSVLHGKAGKGGLFGQGGRIALLDLAIFGDVRYRNDAGFDTGVEGNFADGSLIQNVWVEHTKVGMWIDGPTSGLYAVGMRIRDTFADGVNLHKGANNVRVDQTSIRNTGDDGLAMFSENEAVKNCAFTFNTVQLPMLANAIGIYGGTDNRADDNLLSDTVTASAGVALSTRFKPVPFSGTQSVQRNTLTRTGGYEPNWKSELGALWIYADPDSSDITSPILVKDVDIVDSSYQGILVSFNRTVSGLVLDHVAVKSAGSFGIDIQANGSATLTGVAVTDSKKAALSNPGGFTIQGTGNSGF